MVAFAPNGSGGARLILDDAETELMRRLAGELRAMITSIDSADDPVMERLFPATYGEPADEAAYQELIGDDLTKHKLEALDSVSTTLGGPSADGGSDIDLDGEALHAWLSALTDIRLAIGVRLEVDEDRMAAEIDPSDPDARSYAVLHWLGWIQEGILKTVTGL